MFNYAAISNSHLGQNRAIPLHLIDKKKAIVKYSPFGTVQVLDNRFDRTRLFTYENSNYPPYYITFAETAALSIKGYLENANQRGLHGNDTLLLNVDQLRIPNQRAIYRRTRPDGSRVGTNIRDYFLVKAQAYHQAENDYVLICSINLKYYTNKETSTVNPSLARIMGDIFDDILKLSCVSNEAKSRKKVLRRLKGFENDTEPVAFNKQRNPDTLNISEIDMNVIEKWLNYPILRNQNLVSDGVYLNFDDFRDNTLTKQNFQLDFDVKDSTYSYRSEISMAKRKLPWTIFYEGEFYVYLKDSSYLKLSKERSTFSFTVPQSLPDMYGILSVMESGSPNGSNAAISIADPTANLAANLVYAAIPRRKSKNSYKEYYKERWNFYGDPVNFRKCFIDMDSGDIIY